MNYNEFTEEEMLKALRACNEEITSKDLIDLKPAFVLKMYMSFVRVIMGANFEGLSMLGVETEGNLSNRSEFYQNSLLMPRLSILLRSFFSRYYNDDSFSLFDLTKPERGRAQKFLEYIANFVYAFQDTLNIFEEFQNEAEEQQAERMQLEAEEAELQRRVTELRTRREEEQIEIGQIDAQVTEARAELARQRDAAQELEQQLRARRSETQEDTQRYEDTQLHCNELAQRIEQLEKEVVLPEDEEVYRQRNALLSEANEELRLKRQNLREHTQLLKENQAHSDTLEGLCATAEEYDGVLTRLREAEASAEAGDERLALRSRVEAAETRAAALEAEAAAAALQREAAAAAARGEREELQAGVAAAREEVQAQAQQMQACEEEVAELQRRARAEQASLQTLQAALTAARGTMAARVPQVLAQYRDLDEKFKKNLNRKK